MVAILGWKPSQYRRVFSTVSVAAKFLRMKNLDGSVQFIRRLRLF
jgi:hypothetical protein